jgi:hypothetical protein
MTAALDEVLPEYRHRERHATQIAAAPEEVWSALHAVAGADLRLTRVLMGIRALPARLRRGPTARGGLPADHGFIEAFLDRGFRALRVEPPRTFVAGAAGQPWRMRGRETADVEDLEGFRAFARPGFVLMATSFELEAFGDGTRLSTETRVQPCDAAATRAFRPYWWAIRGGSGLIRRDLLHAVRTAPNPAADPSPTDQRSIESQRENRWSLSKAWRSRAGSAGIRSVDRLLALMITN